MVNPTETAKSKGKGKAVATKSSTKDKSNKRAREESSRPRKSSAESTNPLHISLSICKVQPTRFVDWETVAHLGVKHDMEMMFTAMGVNQFMHQVEFTHADETIQFVRSLAPHGGPDDDSSDDPESGIHFRIHGKSYRLSASEIRDIYGFTLMHMRAEDLLEQGGLMDIWQRTASDSYRMGKSKSSTIRNPTIKLLQRALGFAFFGRHEVGQVILDEWRMICLALRPLVADLQPAVRYIPSFDPTVLFIENLFRAKDTASMKKPDGWPLCIGGVLTPIFRHCGVQLSEPLRPIPLIDIAHLRHCRFLSNARRDVYAYPFTWGGQRQELILPCTHRDLVSLSTIANIVFEHPPADLQPPSYGVGSGLPALPSTAPTHGSARYQQPMHHLPHTPLEMEMVKQISLLQRWCKWQDRSMRKMADVIRSLRGRRRHTGAPTGESSTTRRERSESPGSSNPSLDLSPPPQSDHESDTA